MENADAEKKNSVILSGKSVLFMVNVFFQHDSFCSSSSEMFLLIGFRWDVVFSAEKENKEYTVLTVFTWKKKSWNIQEESNILTGLDCFHNYYVFAEQMKVRIVQKFFQSCCSFYTQNSVILLWKFCVAVVFQRGFLQWINQSREEKIIWKCFAVFVFLYWLFILFFNETMA